MDLDGKLRAHFNALYGDGRAVEPYRRPSLPIRKTYCILITPRSGSTWLTRRIARLDVLSCPDEFFNVNEFGNTLKFNPGRDIYEVFDLVARKNCTDSGLFGFEMSYFDLAEFEREAKLLDVMLGEKHFFYLSRRNFVAQAISLFTAVESGVFHTYQSDAVERLPIPYDGDKIRYWACHILQQEYGFQRWLDANEVWPVRLSYEDLLDDVDGTIRRIARHLGVDLARAGARAIPQTEKITADGAAEYEHRFRHEHREFCQAWSELRGTAPCPFPEIPSGQQSCRQS